MMLCFRLSSRTQIQPALCLESVADSPQRSRALFHTNASCLNPAPPARTAAHTLSLRLAAMHACCSALVTDRYASDRSVYLPTMAMVTGCGGRGGKGRGQQQGQFPARKVTAGLCAQACSCLLFTPP